MGNRHGRFVTYDRLLPYCEPGDLIEILHPHSSYNHWAVYVGGGAIIHARQPWVQRETLQGAVRTGAGKHTDDSSCRSPDDITKLVRINNSKHRMLKLTPQTPQKIIDSASDQLGIEWYNMQLYGCEVFAVRCRYGVKIDMRRSFYKSTDIIKPTGADVSLCNPMLTHGHQQHEF